MRSIIIGISEKGETTLLQGVSTAPDRQRKEIAGYRHKGLPKGLVEIHQLPLSGSIKKAVARPAAAEEPEKTKAPKKPKAGKPVAVSKPSDEPPSADPLS